MRINSAILFFSFFSLLLIQEKEQLLRELRSINIKGRSETEILAIRSEIAKLEQDLNAAMEMSNRAIADRSVAFNFVV